MDQSFELADVIPAQDAYVRRVLLRQGVAVPDVDDLAQEVYLAVHRGISEFRRDSSLRTWLRGICERVASNYRRRAHRRHESLTPDGSCEQVASASPMHALLHVRLRDGIANLTPEQQRVFVLYDLQGFCMRDIAEMVGCSLSTAFTRLYAARRTLKSHVG